MSTATGTVLASIPALWDELTAKVAAGGRFADLFGTAGPDGLLLTAHLAGPAGLETRQAILPPGAATYPALTPRLGAAFWYERELHDMFGVVPQGHPRLEPLILTPAAEPPGRAPAPIRRPPSVGRPCCPATSRVPACSPSRMARCVPAWWSPSSTWWKPRARTSRT